MQWLVQGIQFMESPPFSASMLCWRLFYESSESCRTRSSEIHETAGDQKKEWFSSNKLFCLSPKLNKIFILFNLICGHFDFLF